MILERLLGLTKVLGPSSAASSSLFPATSCSTSSFPPLSLFSGEASHLCSHQHALSMTRCIRCSSFQSACQENKRDSQIQSLWRTV